MSAPGTRPGTGADGPGAGAWLREQRLARGWGKAEMARRLHAAASASGGTVPRVTSIARSLSGWEDGGRYPQDRWRAMICQVLGLAAGDFPSGPGMLAPLAAAEDLDAADPRPWAQVARALLARIGSGELTPGSAMPRTADISGEAGVSAATVRKAYRYLRIREAICYRPGSGYQVAAPGDGARPDDGPGADGIGAVDALRLAWGTQYEIGMSGPRWRARWRDGTGPLIAAAGPGELNVGIREDYMRRAVAARDRGTGQGT